VRVGQETAREPLRRVLEERAARVASARDRRLPCWSATTCASSGEVVKVALGRAFARPERRAASGSATRTGRGSPRCAGHFSRGPPPPKAQTLIRDRHSVSLRRREMSAFSRVAGAVRAPAGPAGQGCDVPRRVTVSTEIARSTAGWARSAQARQSIPQERIGVSRDRKPRNRVDRFGATFGGSRSVRIPGRTPRVQPPRAGRHRRPAARVRASGRARRHRPAGQTRGLGRADHPHRDISPRLADKEPWRS